MNSARKVISWDEANAMGLAVADALRSWPSTNPSKVGCTASEHGLAFSDGDTTEDAIIHALEVSVKSGESFKLVETIRKLITWGKRHQPESKAVEILLHMLPENPESGCRSFRSIIVVAIAPAYVSFSIYSCGLLSAQPLLEVVREIFVGIDGLDYHINNATDCESTFQMMEEFLALLRLAMETRVDVNSETTMATFEAVFRTLSDLLSMHHRLSLYVNKVDQFFSSLEVFKRFARQLDMEPEIRGLSVSSTINTTYSRESAILIHTIDDLMLHLTCPVSLDQRSELHQDGTSMQTRSRVRATIAQFYKQLAALAVPEACIQMHCHHSPVWTGQPYWIPSKIVVPDLIQHIGSHKMTLRKMHSSLALLSHRQENVDLAEGKAILISLLSGLESLGAEDCLAYLHGQMIAVVEQLITEEAKGSHGMHAAVVLVVSAGNQRLPEKYLLPIQMRFCARMSESPCGDGELHFLDLHSLVRGLEREDLGLLVHWTLKTGG